MAKGNIMDNLIPLALVGGGAYLIYKYMQGDFGDIMGGGITQDIPGTTTNGSSATGGNYANNGGTLTNGGGPAPTGTQGSGTATQVGSTSPSPMAQLKAAIQQHVPSGAEMNFWQWNYQIGEVGGVDPGTLDPFVLDSALQGIPNEQVEQVMYTFNQWWNKVSPALSAYFQSQGLGGVISTTQLAFQRAGRYGIPGVGRMANGVGNLETARANEVAISRGIATARENQMRGRVFRPNGKPWAN